MKTTTVDASEVAKFAQHASQWWNTEGPLKTLHDINPARIEFLLKYTKLKGHRVLDVGCGGGILAEGMALKGALVSGLDVEKEAINAAIAHAQTSELNITYSCQPIEVFDAKPFEIITCMEMLEHVAEPQLVINHCARLLESGGYLFLSTINRTFKAYAGVIIAAEYVFGLLPRQTHDYEKFIRPNELAAMVRAAGLEVIGMAGIAYNPFTRVSSLEDSVQVNYLMACRKLS